MDNHSLNDIDINHDKTIAEQRCVNHVESGLPRWLIEMAFVCLILQGITTWTPILHWFMEHAPILLAIIQTFGAVVMFYAVMQGMKSLYKPFTYLWWIVIALNLAGFVTTSIPVINEIIGIPIAISLMLVYIPLGCSIAIFYRGRLQQVGIWMVLYILISAIIPVVWFLFANDSSLMDILLESSTIGVVFIFAWMLRRVLIGLDETEKE
ncbi:MAG: hypothetical protein IIT40_00795 [Prevotella sp.]|nr:hypothetical protein [Prevotella sp.]